MSATTVELLKSWYEYGEEIHATHMIVACDSYDYESYPIYVPSDKTVGECRPSNGDRVEEIYNYSLGWEAQSHGRVNNI